ncbi:MAG TPA: hypothetical protein VL093_01860 [Flavipsychrobacter sp.]|nr:hypothetical protein [Flavipsychrobacter sp.]
MFYQHKKYNKLNGFFVLEQKVPFGTTKEAYTVIEIDGNPIADFPQYAINIQELVKSEKTNGNFRILEANEFPLEDYTWVSPEPIQVMHYGDHVQWEIDSPVFKRIFAFEPKAYRHFIRSMKRNCVALIEQHHSFLSADFRFYPRHYANWSFLKDTIKKAEQQAFEL